MSKLKPKILTVCHDAGGAEVVSAWVKANLTKYVFACLALGPARIILKRKGLGKHIVTKPEAKSIVDSMKTGDLVLTGTSGKAQIEISFIRYAKRRARIAAYLDHWVNYRERFGYPKKNWRQNLPDEIWVGDKHALVLAKRHFKNIKCRLTTNLYWQEVKVNYQKIKNKYKKADNILFMSEPIISDTFNETDVLKKILDYLFEREIKNKVIICYHPAEPKDKYDKLLAQYKNKLKFGRQSQDRVLDFATAKLVIGMKSMSLVIASFCGKKTVSFIPDRRVKCPLPFDEIIKIHDVKQLEKFLC